jgi:hypothetical protein
VDHHGAKRDPRSPRQPERRLRLRAGEKPGSLGLQGPLRCPHEHGAARERPGRDPRIDALERSVQDVVIRHQRRRPVRRIRHHVAGQPRLAVDRGERAAGPRVPGALDLGWSVPQAASAANVRPNARTRRTQRTPAPVTEPHAVRRLLGTRGRAAQPPPHVPSPPRDPPSIPASTPSRRRPSLPADPRRLVLTHVSPSPPPARRPALCLAGPAYRALESGDPGMRSLG